MWSRHKVGWNINLRPRDDFRDIVNLGYRASPGSYKQPPSDGAWMLMTQVAHGHLAHLHNTWLIINHIDGLCPGDLCPLHESQIALSTGISFFNLPKTGQRSVKLWSCL